MLLLLLAAEAAVPVVDLRQRVVDAIRNCPKAAPGEIVVCSRDRGFSEGQRLRPIDSPYAKNGFDPDGPELSVSRERNGLFEQGDAGTGSCSPAGAGGWTGCATQAWRRQRQQNAYGGVKRK